MLAFNFPFQFCKQENQSLFYHIYSLHRASFIYLTFLKNHSLTRLKGFLDIVVIDDIDSLTFRVKYVTYSVSAIMRYLLTIVLPYKYALLSIQNIYGAASWSEREV